MENNQLENYLKGRVSDLLDRVKTFEKKILEDRENFAATRKKLQDYKRANPSSSYEEVKGDLASIQDLHYNSFLLENNLNLVVSNLVELSTLVSFFNVELDLDEEKKAALDTISSMNPNVFTVNDKGEIVITDDELSQTVKATLESKMNDPENLSEIYKSLAY